MLKSRYGRFVSAMARLRAPFLLTACAAFLFVAEDVSRRDASARLGFPRVRQTQRLDLRMRSYAPPASGNVTIEASGDGGSGRLTVLSLPDPRTIAPDARTYVVWAVSEGRIARLGELIRDERGNGGLAFERPDGFERYSIVVTAEAVADAERPGSPVLSTRANEATTLYPRAADERPTTTDRPVAPSPPPPARRPNGARRGRPGGDFYTEVDDALRASGGGRLLEFEGEREAAQASGVAHTATRSGNAYVRANFRGVPLPSTLGASVYVLWAIVPDGRIIYMGSLPSTENLNAAEIYVRTAGFGADPFELFVTAERRRPAAVPSEIKVLTPKHARSSVK